jgi:hypothetical protein
MHRCTGPVSCLPFEMIEKPNGLEEGVRHTSLTHLPTRLETRLSFIQSIKITMLVYQLVMYASDRVMHMQTSAFDLSGTLR